MKTITTISILFAIVTVVAMARPWDAGDACWSCSHYRENLDAGCCEKCITCVRAIAFSRFNGAKWCLEKLYSSGCIRKNTRGLCKTAGLACLPASLIPITKPLCIPCVSACNYQSNSIEKALGALCLFAAGTPDLSRSLSG